jgi:D-inositol-3-phosphate glycosyltransferase
MGAGRVVMGLLFYPRGGSAYVVRYLSPALERAGWEVSLATGSLGQIGVSTNATTFFEGLDVHPLDATDAVRAFERGEDAFAQPFPMHPSYEDREGVPDVIFASVPPELADHLAAAWEEPMGAAGAADADVLHLHHLTPQLDAACRYWPDVPRVVHLHNTELLLLRAIAARQAVAAALGESLATMPSADARRRSATVLDADAQEILMSTRWDAWRHGDFWSERLHGLARAADHLIVVNEDNRQSAVSTLGVPEDKVTIIPNGVDLDQFEAHPRTGGARRAAFRRWLVEDARGWAENAEPGSIRYREADLDRLLGPDDDATVLLYVGRFTEAKRVPNLVRAFARARDRFDGPASLVVWGGHPGEWEGQHPVTVANEVGDDGIFFAGWRGHDDLPAGLALSDVLVLASVDDGYPQTPLEAMAVGLPVVASRSGGLPTIVNTDPGRPTGWMVEPDDVGSLADTLVRVVNRPDERAERAANARAHARAVLSWDGLVPSFVAVYELATEAAGRRVAVRGGA